MLFVNESFLKNIRDDDFSRLFNVISRSSKFSTEYLSILQLGHISYRITGQEWGALMKHFLLTKNRKAVNMIVMDFKIMKRVPKEMKKELTLLVKTEDVSPQEIEIQSGIQNVHNSRQNLEISNHYAKSRPFNAPRKLTKPIQVTRSSKLRGDFFSNRIKWI
jgi:hypothetical protein